uniref:Uncharacterized protein n=2 Tax=NPAAA clade TaxID=2231382 RepID=T2DMV5_PHAVU|nr:hypothetical protein [Phaseolus vulgaris]
MHWMDARALRRKDAFGGERPWGDTVCDPWISDRETVSKLRGKSALFGLLKLSELKHLSSKRKGNQPRPRLKRRARADWGLKKNKHEASFLFRV